MAYIHCYRKRGMFCEGKFRVFTHGTAIARLLRRKMVPSKYKKQRKYNTVKLPPVQEYTGDTQNVPPTEHIRFMVFT